MLVISSYLIGSVIQNLKRMFFPICFAPHKPSRKEYQRYKLEMLKAMRDSMETRLAAVNAAIATIERQTSELESSETT